MKSLLLGAIVLLLFSCNEKPAKKNAGINNSDLLLSMDSGFVTKKSGLPFLIANSLTDTVNSYWTKIKDNDTTGKYYKIRENGNYYYCSIDYNCKNSFETHLLMEINADGKLIRSERFVHGNSPCCWNNLYEGFNRYGDFYGLKICRSGSGYCAENLYLFKKLLPQSLQNEIPQSYSSFYGLLSQKMNSQMTLLNDTLDIDYQLLEEKKDNYQKLRINKRKSFKVRYVYKDSQWMTKDSSKFDGLDL